MSKDYNINNKIPKANSQSELVKIINSEIKYFGLSLHGANPEGNQYMNYRLLVKYNDEILNIKIPTLGGDIRRNLRAIREYCWNESAVPRQYIRDSIKRECEMHEKLKENGIPTFESRQNLMEFNEYLKERVFLTKYIPNTVNVANAVKDDNKDKTSHIIKETARRLSEVHNVGVYMVDSWLGNVGIVPKKGKGGEIVISDYEFTPNKKHSPELIKSRDIAQLVISCVKCSNLSEDKIIELFCEGYDLKKILKLKGQLKHIVKYNEHKLAKESLIEKKIRWLTYQNPVFGISEEKVIDIEKKLLSYIS